MGNPFGGDGNRPSAPGWRGYNTGDRTTKKKKNKEKKKKGFGTL
jgi:signal recognition particle subunit SRP54